jgi:hypothetical protein
VPKTKINSSLGDVLTLTLEYNFVLKIRKTAAIQAWPGRACKNKNNNNNNNNKDYILPILKTYQR